MTSTTDAKPAVDNADDALPPPVPKLVAEWRLRLTLPSGDVMLLARASEAEARATVRRVFVANGGVVAVEVQRRLVTEWSTLPDRGSGARARQQRD